MQVSGLSRRLLLTSSNHLLRTSWGGPCPSAYDQSCKHKGSSMETGNPQSQGVKVTDQIWRGASLHQWACYYVIIMHRISLQTEVKSACILLWQVKLSVVFQYCHIIIQQNSRCVRCVRCVRCTAWFEFLEIIKMPRYSTRLILFCLRGQKSTCCWPSLWVDNQPKPSSIADKQAIHSVRCD